MYQTLHCIALRTTRFNDSRSIVSAWSAERGYVSFAMPAGRGREAGRRRALTMPLSVFEGECEIKPGRDILFMRDLKPMHIGLNTISNPAKLAIALFVAEVLEKILRNTQNDDALNLTLFDTVETLDECEGTAIANFHLWALFRLCQPLGIAPDLTEGDLSKFFDLSNARWSVSRPLSNHWIEKGDTAALVMLGRMNRSNLSRFRLSRDERNRILDGILLYYDLHLSKITPLNSLDVVRELF